MVVDWYFDYFDSEVTGVYCPLCQRWFDQIFLMVLSFVVTVIRVVVLDFIPAYVSMV